MSDNSDAHKFKAILFVILGLVVPLWPISLPLFFYLAYRTYTSAGAPKVPAHASPNRANFAEELVSWKRLLDDGTITQAEFEQQKQRLLGP